MVENTTRNVVSEFLLSSVFRGASSFLSHFCWVWLDYCIILLGASWKMAGHWADLRNQPTTPSSMPAPCSARKAWAPKWGGAACLSSMRLVASDYMFLFQSSTGPVALWVRRCLWCQWHEAHWYGGSNPPRSALIPFGAQKRATPTLTNIENMAIWLPGVTLARAWCCPRTVWARKGGCNNRSSYLLLYFSIFSYASNFGRRKKHAKNKIPNTTNKRINL